MTFDRSLVKKAESLADFPRRRLSVPRDLYRTDFYSFLRWLSADCEVLGPYCILLNYTEWILYWKFPIIGPYSRCISIYCTILIEVPKKLRSNNCLRKRRIAIVCFWFRFSVWDFNEDRLNGRRAIRKLILNITACTDLARNAAWCRLHIILLEDDETRKSAKRLFQETLLLWRILLLY